MEIGVKGCRRKKQVFLVLTILLAVVASKFFLSGGRIWADRSDMTRLQFSSALFCQRISQAILDDLGSGMADGSDCVNFSLYVSTAEIGNIQTLVIVPPEGGFGDIDFGSHPMNINGEWISAFYNLTSLTITDMYLEDISPLGALTGRLTYLDLSNNVISDVSALKNLENSLTYLDLSGNPVGGGMRALSRFTRLTTLKLVNTDVNDLSDLFRPPDVDIEYNEDETIRAIFDAETEIFDEETGARIYGEQLATIPLSSKLAKVLEVLDIHDNIDMSSDMVEEPEEYECGGALAAFKEYPIDPEEAGYTERVESPVDLTITELYANGDHLNSLDLLCIAELKNVRKLDVSNNHIDDFASIQNKSFTSLKVDTQTFVRATESLDYRPLPTVFSQASQENYFATANATNTAVPRDELDMENAQFYGDNVRFINAAIASSTNEEPQPATVAVPTGSGAFEGTKLEVYFEGQVVTFNDANLCNEVYRQGQNGSAFVGLDGDSSWTPDSPVVLTNACNTTKQIAMISGGSSMFLRLTLDRVNNGANVDLTGLEEFDGLQRLSLQNNSLTDISKLSNAHQLQQLWLNNNNLGSENWSVIADNLTGLEILYLNNNYMGDLPENMDNLSSLGNLYMVNNGISDVSPLARAPSITVLDLSENEGITDFSGMVQEDSACNPSILKLENSGVVRIPSASVIAQGFSHLTSLNLNGNRVTSDTIANLASAPRLDELYLNDNRITSTSGFSNITTLKKLFLDGNQITNISGLTSLTRLAELHLSDNQINNVAGLNTLPALATLDLRNQTLTGTITEAEAAYELPAVFAQAISLVFPNVSSFQSAGNYTVVNGEIDYDDMTVTMIDTSENTTVTIPDGSLAGTKVTVTYEGGDPEFGGTLTDYTGGSATITATSANSFTVTSNTACMVLWTGDNGATWTRLESTTVPGESNTRAFSLDQVSGVEVVVAYAGDVNSDHSVNVRDARKIVNSIMGKATMTALEEKLADVDGRGGVNVRDARAVINSIMGTSEINW